MRTSSNKSRLSTLACALLTSVIFLAGCASSKSGDVYTRDQARREMSVRLGTVDSIREVLMEGTKSGAGTVAGGIIGGIAGGGLGGGRGSAISSVLGAIVGGIVGAGVEENATRKRALEYMIRLDDGRMISLVQEDAGEGIRPGERVRVLSGSGESRVTR